MVRYVAIYIIVFTAGLWIGSTLTPLANGKIIGDVCGEALGMIESAKEVVYLAMYNLYYYDDYPTSCSNRIVHALVEAHRRGVNVRIVVEAKDENERAARILDANGVIVTRYSGEALMHAKVLIVDNCVLAGSSNYTFSGLFRNVEFNVKVCGLTGAREWFRNLLAKSTI